VKPPEAAAACIAKALRPGGRFVAEFGGRGNVQMIETAMQTAATQFGLSAPESLWYFPSIAEYAAVLEQAGLAVTFATLFDRPTPLEGADGLRDWIRMFGGGILDKLPATQTDTFLSRVEDLTRPTLFQEDRWVADYRRLRVIAVRET
jgi:trans-aconitate 2-methyltransferase